MHGEIFLSHQRLLLRIDLYATALCHLFEFLCLRIDIHGRHRYLLGVDGGLSGGLAFVVGCRETHLLGSHGEDAVLGQSGLFHLAAVKLRLHAADLYILGEEQDFAFGLVGGLGHLTLIVGLHIGGVDVRQSDALRADIDAAAIHETGVLVFLVGHFGIDGLHGDVLRGDDDIAFGGQLGSLKGTVLVILLYTRPACGAQLYGLHVDGKSVVLVERALVVEHTLYIHPVRMDADA